MGVWRDSIGHSPTLHIHGTPSSVGVPSVHRVNIDIYKCTDYRSIHIAITAIPHSHPECPLDGNAHHWDLAWRVWREPGDEWSR